MQGRLRRSIRRRLGAARELYVEAGDRAHEGPMHRTRSLSGSKGSGTRGPNTPEAARVMAKKTVSNGPVQMTVGASLFQEMAEL